ncbi:IgGFc-binding protein [Osmerus mordax]|uniref:IgGFc-binding protein n=1 Tax=Osmerus mordax TaxID=8014 RepID=UPI00350FA668
MKLVGILSKINTVFAAMGTQLLLCFAALLVSDVCHAGWAGREFAMSFMENYKTSYVGARFQLQIYALQADTRVTVKVSSLNFVKQQTLGAGQAVTVTLPDGVEMGGTELSSKTVQIESSADVTVSAFNYKLYTADTSVIYPVREWGTDYYIFTPSATPLGTFKEFSISNGKEKNRVAVVPSDVLFYQKRLYIAGSQLVVDLLPYQSIQIQSISELTGTRVSSQLPVAVFTGHTCTWKFSKCNHVFEQLLPVSSWGSSFIVPPLSFQKGQSTVIIQASQATRVTVRKGSKVDVVSLDQGKAKEFDIQQPDSMTIQADHGVQVLLLFNGVMLDKGQIYDPFLMTVLPSQRFCSSYFLEGQDGFQNKALLVVKTNELATLRFDGKPLPDTVQWTSISASEFSWAEMAYPQGYPDNRHNLTLGSPFALYSVGVSYMNGYGSPALCGQAGHFPMTCSDMTCKADEVCEMKQEIPTCCKKPAEAGTCWAMGDPHYRTFDGRFYNFMGTCTYVFAKKCVVKDVLPGFEVLSQNENRGSLRVSYVGVVTVKVYGLTITVMRTETGRVRIDYGLWNLPVVLNEGKVVLSQMGRFAVIQTDFGLTVKYDWEHHLVVSLPASYAGKTCGLCGNFNENPNDDYSTPLGTQAGGVLAFGSSWKVPGLVKDALCADECVGGCDRCESSQMKLFEGELYCGLIGLVAKGPFSSCHSVVPPQAYLDNCKFDLCMGGGLRTFLCRALETYTDACQKAGIQVQDWRALARCPSQCSANSHYELCGSPCPATCADPTAPTKCKGPCVEACTCNTGFVLSGGQCVPTAKCGCSYLGRNVPAGESFWDDQTCKRRCRCVPESGRVECQDTGCRAGQQCQVVDGIRDCYPVSYSTCQAKGDPHYLTFDQQRFNFQGTCVYQLAGLCSSDPGLVPFQVLVQNDFRGSRVVSYTKLVEVKVYSQTISISKEYKGQVMVNGELLNLPVSLSEGQISVYKSGWYAVVTTDFGLKVSFDWNSNAFVTLPSTYQGAVCGLCGNYNGKPQDDLVPKNGKALVNALEFGGSWIVEEIPGCLHGCKGTCPECDVTQKRAYETGDFCGLLRDPKGPFRDCHSQVDPAGYFEDCVYDVCLYKGRKDVLCQALTAYTSACQATGAKVYNWRSSQLCEVRCSANSHYDVCASNCPATCSGLSSPQGCQAQCKEGCSCDEGHILSGDSCVPFSQCGCLQGGRYYQVGQVFYPNGKCDEECSCAQDGQVACKKFSCGPNEKCEVVDGVQKCNPVGKAVCQASGDPHYLSFDGLAFDFQGTCTYTLAKACGLDGTQLVPFAVQVENESWNNRKVAVTKLVALEVYGFTLIFRNNMFGVLVDGVFNNLPLSLNNGAVQVYKQGFHYTISTDFGLLVTYDLVYHVTVTVPGNYRDKTCGLCGSFNGNRADDFTMSNNRVTKDVNAFGASWKVAIKGVVCDNGCSGTACPVCDPPKRAVFEKPSHCGVMTAPKGPFAACHSKLDPVSYFNDCVYDLCVSEGDEKVLCDSVAAYAFNCHMAGVDLDWRTSSFCPMKCPVNSHYEACADACSSACPSLTDVVKCSKCSEGCECDAGFLFNGQTCVQQDRCGCYDNGRTYLAGEVAYLGDCSQKCSCDPLKGLVCVAHSCPANTKCLIKKDVKSCYNTDPCKDAGCRAKETCRVEKGETACVPQYTGICWAWGDPHYHTFDGFNYNFQGTCRYIISETCGDLAGLTPFNITESNDNRGNTAVSFVREVKVAVYGFTIAILKNQIGRVMVDGQVLNLPLDLGQVTVSQSGGTAVIQTDFGLRVSYDWNWKVVVALPSSYFASVCGLCGNFNGNVADELQNATGKTMPSVVDWAKGWKSADQEDTPCADACKGNCPECEESARKLYQSEASCGILTAKAKSVFQVCHSKVDPQTFMDSCVYDLCVTKGDKKMLCQALASFTEQCRQVGIVVKDWRTQFGCPMNCQSNSHYDICASPCQPSCPFPEQRPTCPDTCVEACACDKGYVLSAGVCVPAKTCGCSYQGRYYQAGERFWADEVCGRLCECDATLGMVVCRVASCSANEQCSLVGGKRACSPVGSATCVAAGDPHYRTFDGRRFDFQGTCVYQLVALCVEKAELVPFKVTVQNDHRGSMTVSFTKTVVLSMYGVSVTISKDYPSMILLNGQLSSLPLDFNGQLRVFRSGAAAVVETSAGISLTFDWRSVVKVTVPSTYQGAVCGLCGNYNTQPQDDLGMRDGQIASDPSKLGESWRVGLVPGCTSGCQAGCQGCSDSQKETFKGQAYCGIITNKQGPFKDCHGRVDPTGFLEDCVFDTCHYHGYRGAVCDAVAAYVSACQGQGASVGTWRTPNFCPLVCPANSQYSLCAPACPATCASLSSLSSCKRPCAEGCQCDEGYLLSGEACVPVAKCGCSSGGRYYRMGDVFYSEDKCLEQCSCGENGAVTCQKAKCRPGEVCKVAKGVQACYPESEAKCVASGDPHYITFDGRRFDFQGICVYTLAKVCDDAKGQLSSFAVTQGNEKYGNGRVAVTKTVAVEVYGHIVSIEQGVKWRVIVDDEWMNLPLSLSEGRVTVSQEGRNIIVQSDFGLRVLYDTTYYVEVVVPSTYQGKMCGLCGNYDKNPADDFRLPGGKQTRNVDDFGSAWVVDLPGSVCGGCGGQCPACDQAKAALYGRPDSCGIITAAGGPFQACHGKVDPAPYFAHCVYDVCALEGDKETLCQGVQAYAVACQHAGVQIQPWRSPSFCPATCPANSHFEQCADTCASSCASLMSPFPCSDTCFEGCLCDAGFVSDGDKCVSMETCGCIHEGQYLQVGQTVVNKDCNSKCVCQASGVVNCQQVSCASGEVCDVRDGVRACHPKQGRCLVSPAAYLTSFDGMEGATGGLGAFEVASLCDQAPAVWFRVVVDVRVCSKGAAPAVAAVYVFFKDVAVAVNSEHLVWVNGRKTSLPSTLADHLTVQVSNRMVVVERTSSVRVTYSISQEVVVTVGNQLAGKVCGACGNYNDNPKDDLKTADGAPSSDVSVIVGSWRAWDFSNCGL